MIDYTSLFCLADDFLKYFHTWFQKLLLTSGTKKRNRATKLHISEIITILISYAQSGFRCFKDYYGYVWFYHRGEFPNLVSYERFIALIKRCFPITVMFFAVLRGDITEISFADSTPYAVCKTIRRFSHKVFKGIAALSKNSVGWFFGLKLHLVFNDKGEIARLSITPADVDDRKGLKDLLTGLTGKIFADRGYVGQKFFDELWEKGIHIVTRIRKNMKNKLMSLWDRFYLGKRITLESILSSIKSCGTFEHSRHRNVVNAFVHILCALIAYQLRPIKPTFREHMEGINP